MNNKYNIQSPNETFCLLNSQTADHAKKLYFMPRLFAVPIQYSRVSTLIEQYGLKEVALILTGPPYSIQKYRMIP